MRFPVPLGADNNVVDWDVNQLDKESDESHDGEADSCSHCDLLELLSVRLRATFDQTNGILGKLPQGLDVLSNLIHFGLRTVWI